MSLDTFEAALAALPPSVESVRLHGDGEPLLQPELEGMIAGVRRSGRKAAFITNGVLLSPEN